MGNDRFLGMTVNERLFDASLLGAWDAAVRAREAAAMTDILVRVAITKDGARQIVTTVLANPKRYGF